MFGTFRVLSFSTSLPRIASSGTLTKSAIARVPLFAIRWEFLRPIEFFRGHHEEVMKEAKTVVPVHWVTHHRVLATDRQEEFQICGSVCIDVVRMLVRDLAHAQSCYLGLGVQVLQPLSVSSNNHD